MTLFLAIFWTISLCLNIISCVLGGAPTWLSVFCPLIIVVMDRWLEYFKSKRG